MGYRNHDQKKSQYKTSLSNPLFKLKTPGKHHLKTKKVIQNSIMNFCITFCGEWGITVEPLIYLLTFLNGLKTT